MTIPRSSAAGAWSPQVSGPKASGTPRCEILANLLTRCANQDETALSDLYDLTGPWLYGVVSRRTTTAADANDATVAAYVTIWRQAARFAQSDQSVLAWMTTIAFSTTSDLTTPTSAAHGRGCRFSQKLRASDQPGHPILLT